MLTFIDSKHTPHAAIHARCQTSCLSACHASWLPALLLLLHRCSGAWLWRPPAAGARQQRQTKEGSSSIARQQPAAADPNGSRNKQASNIVATDAAHQTDTS
eukprot:COSAG01_NODE_33727_length_559_cov_3.915217_1_plen_101_part_10